MAGKFLGVHIKPLNMSFHIFAHNDYEYGIVMKTEHGKWCVTLFVEPDRYFFLDDDDECYHSVAELFEKMNIPEQFHEKIKNITVDYVENL
jgi:uncharacterized membrane-anchored protein